MILSDKKNKSLQDFIYVYIERYNKKIIQANMYFPSECRLTTQRGARYICICFYWKLSKLYQK
jgi:hypothetical protein